jgi:uncharacterized protein YxeA
MNKYLIVVVLLVLVNVGGWLYFNTRQTGSKAPATTENNNSSTQEQGSQKIAASNLDSINWVTYTNKENHYTVQIPKNWVTNNTTSSFGVPGGVAFYPHPELDGFGTPSLNITVIQAPLPRYTLNTQKQYEEWLAAPVSTTTTKSQYKIGNVTVAGIPAVQYKIVSETEGAEPFSAVITWFRYNEKNYYVEFAHPADNELAIYNKILSTLQLDK